MRSVGLSEARRTQWSRMICSASQMTPTLAGANGATVAPGVSKIAKGSPDGAGFLINIEIVTRDSTPILLREATLAPPLGWIRRFAGTPNALADSREMFGARLALVVAKLADGRPYLAADRLTLADISVGYTLGLSDLFGIHDLVPPAVVAYEDRLKARPAYQRAYAA